MYDRVSCMEENEDIVDDLVAQLDQMAQIDSGKKSDINLVGQKFH